MIVVRIDGGLGNQLFQVAYGLQLAQRHGSDLVLDLASYECRPQHGYMLDRFNVTARALQPHERRRLPRRYRASDLASKAALAPDDSADVRPSRRRFDVKTLLARDGLTRVREKPFGFDDKYLNARDDCYAVGYWQSERFFPDVQTQVRRQFRPSVAMSPQSERLYERMLATPSISLHIRRGDYVSNPQAASIYRHLSLDYYRRCVDQCLATHTDAHVVIFSNDIGWCRQQLALPCPVHFVEHTTAETAHEDLWLMTAAQCHVIANSTFSWWGAWLAQRPDQTVYAPRLWFHTDTLDDRSLACSGWTLMDEPGGQYRHRDTPFCLEHIA